MMPSMVIRGARFPRGLVAVPWGRSLRWAVLGLALAVLPAGNAAVAYYGRVWAWDYYAGDTVTRAQVFAFRNAALALAERIAYLQGGDGGERPAYRWGPQAGGETAGFVETGRGYLPLAMREHVAQNARKVRMGVVENDTGAIVMAIDEAGLSECHSLANWLSAYTASRAAAAFVGRSEGQAVAREAVNGARWEPFASAMEACQADKQGTRTLLLRFDGHGAQQAG